MDDGGACVRSAIFFFTPFLLFFSFSFLFLFAAAGTHLYAFIGSRDSKAVGACSLRTSGPMYV